MKATRSILAFSIGLILCLLSAGINTFGSPPSSAAASGTDRFYASAICDREETPEDEISFEAEIDYQYAVHSTPTRFKGFKVTGQYSPPIERRTAERQTDYKSLSRKQPDLPPNRANFKV